MSMIGRRAAPVFIPAFATAGGNFLDTANLYTAGTSETYLGEFIAAEAREHAEQEAEKVLADARAKANAIAQENRTEVLKELEAEQSKVDAQLADKLAKAEKQIAATREKAMGEVENIAGQLVDDVVQELTGSKPSAAAVKSAIAAANR